MITFDDFKKVEMRVGEILSAEKVEGADKLLKLRVDFGLKSAPVVSTDAVPVDNVPVAVAVEEHDIRQILSGIAESFPDPSQLVGKRYAFVTNLPPRTIRGLESQGMIIGAGTPGQTFTLFEAQNNVPVGTRLS